ncbi:hypothetical protein C9374_000840 [Naegleria lovaniensis]|uniref:F-box domain-containing protein n=1 Tax=Naegleria lovaniensis TaxID=51637 RepID=A0AA88GW02_NAELO|nr:uncharacterized protein C9374_000840 [Naegleria lovaniensis]KAG2387990.1 hypothetical protein C9374_000840 [Naegleria lovaniensis]
MGELLVVTLLRFLKRAIIFGFDAISILFYLPVSILLFIQSKLSGSFGYKARYPGHHGSLLSYYLIFIFFYLVTTVATPSIVLYPLLIVYQTFVWYISNESNTFWVATASVGVVFICAVSLSVRACILLDKLDRVFDGNLFEDWIQVQVHGILYVLSIIAFLVNPVRFVVFLKDAKTKLCTQYVDVVGKQAKNAVYDLICIPFALLILVTMWRVPIIWRSKWNHKLFIDNGLYVLMEIPVFTICIPISLLAFYRVKYFIQEFAKLDSANSDRMKFCIKQASESLVDIPFILMGSILACTIYRFIPVVKHYFSKDTENKKTLRRVIFEHFCCFLLDLPAVLSYTLIFMLRYRLPIAMKISNSQKELGNFLHFHHAVLWMAYETLLDIVHIILCTPVFVTLWRASHLYSAIFIDVFYTPEFFENQEDEDNMKKMNLVEYEIFKKRRAIARDILKNWIIDVVFIILGLLSVWRIPRIILHFMTIITNEEKAGSMRNKAMEEFIQSILDVLALTGLCIVLIPTLYRLPTLITRLRSKEGKLYQFIIFSEIVETFKDLPFIVMGLLSMWRIPIILLKIWLLHPQEYDTSEKRRNLAKEQFIDAMLDLPFVISFILMVLSIMHIFTLYMLTRKYFKFKKEETDISKKRELFTFFRGKILKQLYLLPLQIPLILCTYLVTFTFYRIPITITTMKKIPGQKEPKKLAAKVIVSQALSIPLDIITLLFSTIIMCTYYRSDQRSHSSSPIDCSNILGSHQRYPLLVLLVISSITVWRIRHILRALQNEKDYKKRLVLLGANALLTLGDVPCAICALLVLFSWRAKRMVSIIHGAYVAGKLAQVHFSIFLEFYEYVLDLIHIMLVPLLLWRIPLLIRNVMKMESIPEMRKEVLEHLKQIILDVPFILCTIIVSLSIYRNIEIYHFLTKKKNKKPYREFIVIQLIQLLYDIPLVVVATATCIVIPYRVYHLVKYLFFYPFKKDRDNERRRELRVLIAKTLVDLLTLIFGFGVLLLCWRIPFFVHKYLTGTPIKRSLWVEFRAGVLDVCSLFMLAINLVLFYQFPYTVQRLYYFTITCCKHLFKYLPELWKKVKTPKPAQNSTPKVIPSDNGEILPQDMLFEILTFLPPEDNAQSFDRVCKHWHEQARQDSVLWKLYLDADSLGQFIEQDMSKKYGSKNRNANYYGYPYNSYPRNSTLNEKYYNAIGTYRNEDFSHIFAKAFSSESENRNQYVKRYLSIKERYLSKQYSLQDALEDDYRLGFHEIVFKEFAHTITHLYKIFLVRYKIIGTLLFPLHFVIRKAHGRQFNTYDWDRAEEYIFDVLAECYIFIHDVLVFVVMTILDIFPFMGYRWWGQQNVELYNYHSYKGWNYFKLVCLSFASIIATLICVIIAFAITFSPFVFNVRSWLFWSIMSIGKTSELTQAILSFLKFNSIASWLLLPQTIALGIQDYIIGFVFYLLGFILNAESGFLYWVNVVLFVLLWAFIIFWFYVFTGPILECRPYFRANYAMRIIVDLYAELLKVQASFCKNQLGFLAN